MDYSRIVVPFSHLRGSQEVTQDLEIKSQVGADMAFCGVGVGVQTDAGHF